MYLTSEAVRLFDKDPHSKAPAAEAYANLDAFKKQIDAATKFIPLWVKVAVAIALGLGTMVGWKRIVVTIGERIGKTHLTYAQGACAEVVAMSTIAAADMFGLPVSTTHVLSSGVAGTMAPTARAFSGSRCATCSWPGCSPYRPRSYCRACSTGSSGRYSEKPLRVQTPSSMRPGSSSASLMFTRNCTASRPSMMR